MKKKAPKRKGTISEIYFMAKCLENEWVVADVLGDCERYDCVIDRGNGLERVQIKTANLIKGVLVFPCCSSTYHVPEGSSTKHEKQSYRGQIDLFGIYSPDLNKCYIVPVDKVGFKQATLRVEASKNNQAIGVRWAKDYEI